MPKKSSGGAYYFHRIFCHSSVVVVQTYLIISEKQYVIGGYSGVQSVMKAAVYDAAMVALSAN